MDGLERLFWTAIGAGTGHVIGNLLGNTPEEKKKLSTGLAFIGGGIALSETNLVEEIDTVNYTLLSRGKRVYEGIVYEDRLKARIREHMYDGKKFDSFVYTESRTRSEAMLLEQKRIRQYAPKYNIQHNN